MDDREFLRLFHHANLPREEFRHKGQLRLAWLVLSHHGRDDAEKIVAREISRLAAASGASNRYHGSLTRFWVRLVGHAMENAPEAGVLTSFWLGFPSCLTRVFPTVTGRERLSTRNWLVGAGLNRTWFHYLELKNPAVGCRIVVSVSRLVRLLRPFSLHARTITARC